MSDGRAALRAALLDLDVEPHRLRANPQGHGWLRPELRALVERDEACRAEVRAFVCAELELYDRARAVDDPFFARSVISALPRPLAGTALTPRQRALILGSFHVLGAATAYVVLWQLSPERLLSWLDRAHGWLVRGVDAGGMWPLAVGAAVLALACILPRSHRPPA
jgi:hypothetical protein